MTNRSEMLLPWILGGLGMLVILTPFAAYYLNIGQFHPVSDQQAVWAEFGDFVGGVANPFIALLALIGLLVTIRMQQREFQDVKESMQEQVDIAKNQAQTQSLLSLMQSVMRDIETIESEQIVVTKKVRVGNDKHGKDYFRQQTVDEFSLGGEYQKFLSQEGDYFLIRPPEHFESAKAFHTVRRLQRAINTGEAILEQFSETLDSAKADPIYVFYDAQLGNRASFIRAGIPDFEISKGKQ
ncbi:hypothetical protein MED297_00180 [Reinekea sp. MED297]|uniref:Uncharacterized protein n=2 Tax=Reinekea TaxID=230494 RepID=A4BJZ0_9GAMM|nr:hypothetical protein MED297_00180 [Reinekea sp. MED297] [Reinekea blandensis MED297]